MRRPRGSTLAVGLVLAVLAILVFHETWLAPGSRAIGPAIVDAPTYGGLGLPNADHEQTVWYVRFTDWALRHLRSPLVSDRIDWPRGVNLMWNAAVPLGGLVVWPITAVAGPVVAVNVLLTGALVVAGLGATLLARRLVDGPVAVAGLVFAFSPFFLGQVQAHANIVCGAALFPFWAIAVHELLVCQRWPASRAGALLGVLLGVGVYLSTEMVLLGVVALAVVVLLAILVAPREVPLWGCHALLGAVVAVVVALLVAAPGLAVALFGPRRLTGPIRHPDTYVTDLANIIVPTAAQAVAPPAAVSLTHRFTGNSLEWTGYLGVPVVLLVAIVVTRRWRRATIRFLTGAGLVLFLLSLGPRLHVAGRDTGVVLPWEALLRLPLVDKALTGRLSAAVDLVVALLLTAAVDEVLRWRRRAIRAVGATLVAAASVALCPSFSLPAAPLATPSFFTRSIGSVVPEDAVVLVVPIARHASPAPMLWQAMADMRFVMPEGYALVPTPEGGVAEEDPPTAVDTVLEAIEERGALPLDAPTVATVRAALRRSRVEVVVVGPMAHAADAIAALTVVLDTPPRLGGGVAIFSHVEEHLARLGA